MTRRNQNCMKDLNLVFVLLNHLTRSLRAITHPRCVGWGEIGLDYHYDNSPREVQRDVLTRQLRHAVRLGKPLTIHTREADQDIERILKEEVPKDHKVLPICQI
jgi:TatD DNase family protein